MDYKGLLLKNKSSTILKHIYELFFPFFRTKRMNNFINVFQPGKDTKIIDVGGTAYNWKIIDINSKITLLNIITPDDERDLPNNYTLVEGDGTNMKYSDAEFDISFSNSVIEHLGTFERQKLFAQEACRVGEKIWVQTPARSFFFEPHWLGLFIHYFPIRVQRKLVRYFTIRGLLIRPNQEYIDKFLAELRLLTYKEMQQLFPDCDVVVERFLGMAKAYIAVRK